MVIIISQENARILEQIRGLLSNGERLRASEIAQEVGLTSFKVAQLMVKWGSEYQIAYIGREKGLCYWGLKDSIPRKEKRTEYYSIPPKIEEYSEEYLAQKREERLLHFRKHYSPARA